MITTMKTINWGPLQKKYGGKWVALKQDERTVIAAATTLKDAHKKALRAGFKRPIMVKMPSTLLPFIG